MFSSTIELFVLCDRLVTSTSIPVMVAPSGMVASLKSRGHSWSDNSSAVNAWVV